MAKEINSTEKHLNIFFINKEERIVIDNEMPLEQMQCSCEIPLLLITHNNVSIVSIENIHETMLIFQEQLQKVLHNDLPIHESIGNDIGYAYNEYLAHIYAERKSMIDLVYRKKDGFEEWVGDDYKLWGHDVLTSWLYNNHQGAIVFEVTPICLALLDDCDNHIKINVYEEWISDYKPFIIRTIPREVAEQWLKQAQELVTMLEKNNQPCHTT